MERLAYSGPRQPGRLVTQQALNLNRWLITEMSQISSGYCLTWANGHDDCSFVISLGLKKYSPPLHYVKVAETNPESKMVTWSYFKPIPKQFTDRNLKYFSKKKAGTRGAFYFTDNRQTVPFDPDNIVLGWDLDGNESTKCIPEMQYERCQQQIKCIVAAQEQNTDASGSGAAAATGGVDSDSDSDSDDDVPLARLANTNTAARERNVNNDCNAQSDDTDDSDDD